MRKWLFAIKSNKLREHEDEDENKAPDLTRTTLLLVFVGFLDLIWALCCFLDK